MRTMERHWEAAKISGPAITDDGNRALTSNQQALLAGDVGNDVERADLTEEELQAIEDAQIEASTRATGHADVSAERVLLEQMESIANQARGTADARVRCLIEWVQKHMCPPPRKRSQLGNHARYPPVAARGRQEGLPVAQRSPRPPGGV